MEIGSVAEPVAQPRRLSSPGASLKRWVYGYLPYWSSNLNTAVWDSLTHVAFFDVGVDSSGVSTSTVGGHPCPASFSKERRSMA